MLTITAAAEIYCQQAHFASIYQTLNHYINSYPDCELQLDDNGFLQLQADKILAKKPFTIQFSNLIKRLHHIQQRQLHGEFLIKLLGKQQLFIIDGTAGFGRDSFLMAAAGHKIQAYEQNPLIALLLIDALNKPYQDPRILTACKLINISATRLNSEQLANYPEDATLYIDPMFIHEQRKKVKTEKYSQFLQSLNQHNSHTDSLPNFLTLFAESRLETIIIKQSDHDSRDAALLLNHLGQKVRLHQHVMGSGFAFRKYNKC
jgi:hypothetical protein